MNPRELKRRLDEFQAHVWDHTSDDFQTSFDVVEPISGDDMRLLDEVCDALAAGKKDTEIALIIGMHASVEPESLYTVLRVSGLTRSKPISDLRAGIAASLVKIPGKVINLPNDPAVWAVAGPYVAQRSRTVLTHVASLTSAQRHRAYQAINAAAWPGWIRQQRAKLSGHQPEQRAALMLVNLGIPFEPSEKATNPLCADAQFEHLSFDLVVPNATRPKVVMRSTVQTSNIGVFGQARAAEVVGAVQTLSNLRAANRPELVALVDGVGFTSNPRGLEGVLQHVDEFCQFATLWKFAALAATATRRKIEVALPSGHEREHRAFISGTGSVVTFAVLTDKWMRQHRTAALVPAGEAMIRVL